MKNQLVNTALCALAVVGLSIALLDARQSSISVTIPADADTLAKLAQSGVSSPLSTNDWAQQRVTAAFDAARMQIRDQQLREASKQGAKCDAAAISLVSQLETKLGVPVPICGVREPK